MVDGLEDYVSALENKQFVGVSLLSRFPMTITTWPVFQIANGGNG